MPQSLHRLNVHIVFSTKNRQPFLAADIRPPLFAFMAGILQNMECHNCTIGGVEDHVHIACGLTKKHASVKVMEVLKKDSSKWIKTQSAAMQSFAWQKGYGLFSVSPVHMEPLGQYIRVQEQHHKRETFQDELRRIMQRNGVVFDERYVWD